MKKRTRKKPWLGLESYQEGDVLYGRDDDIRNLIQCVLNDVETLLYGKSGIGKSSLLNAGILPAARRNGYLPILIRLSHKEDENYLHQIKLAIISSMEISIEDKEEINRRIKKIVDSKDENKETLYEFFHRHTFHDKNGQRIKLLILFDQFEEIFTLQSNESKKKTFFAQMADVLNNIMPNELQPISANTTLTKERTQIDSNNVDDVFDEIDLGFKTDEPEYIKDNDIHFVFTIREDLLSEFEYYTAAIPTLKHNRYGLRPINEEQASQIILNPEPGLISLSVAKLIIEKVTGRADFKIDGIPEIEVDSAILSLYLSRLYEKMDKEGETKITVDLVETYSANIIEDFYSNAIKDISKESIEWLEDTLINTEGRRDNRDISTILEESHLSEDQLNNLINKHKLLRCFTHEGSHRIEFIHDVISPIVVQRKKERMIKVQQKKMRSRNILLSTICVTLFAILLYFFFTQWNNTVQTYTIVFKEDSTINLNEYWKANVVITDGNDTLIRHATIDKTSPVMTFQTEKELSELPFIHSDFVPGFIVMDSINFDINQPNNILVLLTQKAKRKKISGRVFSTGGSGSGICDALVIIDDQLAKTNFSGNFDIYVDNGYQDSIIRIVKSKYALHESKINSKGKYFLKFSNPEDYDFYNMAKKIQKEVDNSDNRVSLNGPIKAYNRGKYIGEGDSRMELIVKDDSISGYLYYERILDDLIRRKVNRYNAYFIIDGTIDTLNNTFKLKMFDSVYNTFEYEGTIDNNTWMGRYYEKDQIKSEFELK